MDWLVFWRDVSVIWLSLFCFVGLLPPLVLGYFAVRGMRWVLRKSDWLFDKAQGYTRQGRTIVDEASQRAVAPVIAAQKQGTKVETVLRRLWPSRPTASARPKRTAGQSVDADNVLATPPSRQTKSEQGVKVYG